MTTLRTSNIHLLKIWLLNFNDLKDEDFLSTLKRNGQYQLRLVKEAIEYFINSNSTVKKIDAFGYFHGKDIPSHHYSYVNLNYVFKLPNNHNLNILAKRIIKYLNEKECKVSTQKTGSDFRNACLKNKIRYWDIHKCSLCGYDCGFLFFQFTESEVVYDHGCVCTGRYDKSLRTWDDVARLYNMNINNTETITRYNSYWGFNND